MEDDEFMQVRRRDDDKQQTWTGFTPPVCFSSRIVPPRSAAMLAGDGAPKLVLLGG